MDATHALEDGGGRELAYVAMSRARGESHVHVVAPDSVKQPVAWPGPGARAPPALGRRPVTGGASGPPVPRAPGTAGRGPSRPLGRTRPGPAPAASAVEQDTADLHSGTGRWAASIPRGLSVTSTTRHSATGGLTGP